MRDIAKTKAIREALALAKRLLDTEGAPVGEIIGETGTGKTMAALAVMREFGATRVAAHEGMTRYQLVRAITALVGVDGPATRHLDLLAEWAGGQQRRPLLIIDEANKLRWQSLELLRYLADECGFAVLLVGTELYERQFLSARTRPLLLQLGRRIGAKRHRMGRLDRAETYAHILRPAVGDVADKDLITKFWTGARRGNWGDGVELAFECRQLMEINEITTLTPAVLDAALAWSANRIEGGAAATASRE